MKSGLRLVGVILVLLGLVVVYYGWNGIPSKYALEQASAVQFTQVYTESIRVMILGVGAMVLGAVFQMIALQEAQKGE